jgi:hypothetical protein
MYVPSLCHSFAVILLEQMLYFGYLNMSSCILHLSLAETRNLYEIVSKEHGGRLKIMR